VRNGARAFALLAALALAGVACGGSGANAIAPGSAKPSSTGTAATCPTSAPLPSPANDHGAAPATGATMSIQANDFFFAPTCVTGVPGGAISLTVHNASQTLHNVTFQSLGIDRDVPPGQTVTVTVEVATTSLPFFCKYHRTSGMVGALLPSGG
jgi:plastocyanin